MTTTLTDTLPRRADLPATDLSWQEPAGRPWEQRGYLWARRWRDLVMSPLVAPLARLGVPPWLVSLAGVAFAATLYLTLPRWPLLALAGFAAALLCDAVDGGLARRGGCASPRGKLLDLLCDSATLAAVVLALVAAGAVSPVRAAYAAYVTLLLLFVAVCFHSTRPAGEGDADGGDRGASLSWSLRPRGGFYAHFPKVPIYAALVIWLLGGPRWLDPAVLLANVLATLFVLPLLARVLRPGAAAEGRPALRPGAGDSASQ